MTSDTEGIIKQSGVISEAWEVLAHDHTEVLLPLEVLGDGHRIDLTGIAATSGGSSTVMWTEEA